MRPSCILIAVCATLSLSASAKRRVKVEGIVPALGRHEGGLQINVTGAGFVVSTDPKCRFASDEAVATVISPTLMTCRSPFNPDRGVPPHNGTLLKTLEVTLNGVDWTNSLKQFRYYDYSLIGLSLLEPHGGPVSGGTQVLIHGTGFHPSAMSRCRWAGLGSELKAVATYVSPRLLKCVTAVLDRAELLGAHNASFTLEVALDDREFTTLGKPWTYYDPAQVVVSAVDPTGGPAAGGTVIEVLGSGFAQLGGDTLPRRDTPAGRQVRAWTQSWNESAYLTPYARSGTYCLFSSVDAAPGDELSVTAEATYLGPESVACRTPPYGRGVLDGLSVLLVEVAINGEVARAEARAASNATFTLYDTDAARLVGMDRSGGPVSGGTAVRIRGKVLHDFSLRALPGREHVLRCHFGWAGDSLATLVEDGSEVKCLSPRPYGTGHQQSVEVDLTMNGQDYLLGRTLAFTYTPRAPYSLEGECADDFGAPRGGTCLNNYTGVTIFALEPFGGPHAGGTEVVVLGRLFATYGPTVECQFGGLAKVPGTVLNESAVRCVSPASPAAPDSFSDYALEVTLNGEDNFLTAAAVPFVYYRHNETLRVSSLYPRAGPKAGGGLLTLHGRGFRELSAGLEAGRGRGALFGCEVGAAGPDIARCATARPAVPESRGLHCVFEGLPPVKASVPAGGEAGGGGNVTCRLPALPDGYLRSRGLEEDDVVTLCVEVTLNGNSSQATQDCVSYTYYDL